MADILLNVQMRKGTGFGLWVTIEKNAYHFTESGAVSIELAPNSYVATIGGQEPTTASITISFKQGKELLAEEEYRDPIFFGFISFEVK